MRQRVAWQLVGVAVVFLSATRGATAARGDGYG
jgi:hypothetical protein